MRLQRKPNRRAGMLTELDETIRSEMDRSSVTGLAIVILRNGEIVDVARYGVASIETNEPVEPDTMFGIMSVTKPIVGTAVLQLRDAGKFAGCVATNSATVALAVSLGYRLLAGGVDVLFLREGSDAKLRELRRALAPRQQI